MSAYGERLQQALRAQPALSRGRVLLVVASEQRLWHLSDGVCLADYPVSTSRFGLGCRDGSHQTPLGWHAIAERIGAGESRGEIFVGRRPQGRTAQIARAAEPLDEDLITSRILWLRGLERGRNLGDGCDSHQRYIYIHGTADEGRLGSPASIGCVRMGNDAIITLFEQVAVGDRVLIVPDWVVVA